MPRAPGLSYAPIPSVQDRQKLEPNKASRNRMQKTLSKTLGKESFIVDDEKRITRPLKHSAPLSCEFKGIENVRW